LYWELIPARARGATQLARPGGHIAGCDTATFRMISTKHTLKSAESNKLPHVLTHQRMLAMTNAIARVDDVACIYSLSSPGEACLLPRLESETKVYQRWKQVSVLGVAPLTHGVKRSSVSWRWSSSLPWLYRLHLPQCSTYAADSSVSDERGTHDRCRWKDSRYT
jgi:hypothetical protein